MPPIWALQGLFLFAVLIVCGASYQIERFYSVNLAALVIGIAVLAVVVVAPVHAFYRNFHPLNEGRNFYQQSAVELTRQWHRYSDAPLPAVGGDEGLAFAMAFYSPDHPLYEVRLVHPNAEKLPREVTFEQGWAALSYDGDTLLYRLDGKDRGARFQLCQIRLRRWSRRCWANPARRRVLWPSSCRLPAGRTTRRPRAWQKISAPFAAAPRKRMKGPV